MLTAYSEEKPFQKIQVKVKPVNLSYGAWITPKGKLIPVSEYDGHFKFAMEYLYPRKTELTALEANQLYIDMYSAGFLRLTYTHKGYKIEKGIDQTIKNCQLSYTENADSVDCYTHRN